MAKVTMQLDGMEALKRAVTEAPKELRRHMSAAIRASTNAVADEMRRFASEHAQSGALLQSIEAKVPASATGLSASVEINREAYHWIFLEYGTVRMSARPFIRPAAERETPRFLARVDNVGTLLERFWEQK